MKKILVIEDEKDIRDLISDVLLDYQVVEARNGAEGVEKAKEHLPDMILCDIQMPVLSGYSVLVELRKDPKTESIPFIFLTSRAKNEDFRKGMGLGADDYITKPFSVGDLLTAIQTQFEKQEKAAKELEQLRSNLSFMLPHEFRTPLVSILGFSQFLMDPEYLPDTKEIAKMGEMIYKNGKRLEKLVENYLFYTHLELRGEEESEINKQNRDFCCITADVIKAKLTKIARNYDREGDLVLEISEERVAVPGKFYIKIFEHLVDNAFKFSEKGEKVEVRTQNLGDRYELTVKDHGRGITKEQIRRIGAFVQFERKKYEQQGLGLGLGIVEKIVKFYDGELKIQSEPGEGTEIKVIFDVYQ